MALTYECHKFMTWILVNEYTYQLQEVVGDPDWVALRYEHHQFMTCTFLNECIYELQEVGYGCLLCEEQQAHSGECDAPEAAYSADKALQDP